MPKSQGDSRSQQDVMTCTIKGSLLLWKEWCLKCPLDESLLVVDLLMDHLSKV